MVLVEEFERLMRAYDEEVQGLQKNRKMFDGVFGLGNHPGNAACHERMDENVAALCERADAEECGPEERAALVREIFRMQNLWQGPEYARLMLAAIQRHTLGVIPRLRPEDRAELRDWYDREYPRRKRLPVQEQVMKALKG